MTIVVLVILAVIWALYIASWMRSRAQLRSGNSITSFNQHLSVLERTRVGATPSNGYPAGAGSYAQRLQRPYVLDPMVRPPQVRGLLSGPPITLQDARTRRRHVLMLLGGTTAVVAVPAVLFGGAFTVACAGFATVLGLYLFLMVRAQRLADERREKVRYLAPAEDRAPEPVLVLQHSAR